MSLRQNESRCPQSKHFLVILTSGGAGYHEVVTVARYPNFFVFWGKYVLVFAILSHCGVLFPKLAILAIYLRIFTPSIYRNACWVLVALLISNWIATIVAAFFICIPLNLLWNPGIVGGHCFDIGSYYRWSSFFSVLTDLMMLVLPLPVIWKLNTSRNVKLGLTVVFGIGGV